MKQSKQYLKRLKELREENLAKLISLAEIYAPDEKKYWEKRLKEVKSK